MPTAIKALSFGSTWSSYFKNETAYWSHHSHMSDVSTTGIFFRSCKVMVIVKL